MFSNWMRKYRRAKHGIRTIIAWRHILFEDRDNDHAYLYRIMHFKMMRMSEYHRVHGTSTDSLQTARTLKTAATLAYELGKEEKPGYHAFDADRAMHRQELFDLMSRKIDGWWD